MLIGCWEVIKRKTNKKLNFEIAFVSVGVKGNDEDSAGIPLCGLCGER